MIAACRAPGRVANSRMSLSSVSASTNSAIVSSIFVATQIQLVEELDREFTGSGTSAHGGSGERTTTKDRRRLPWVGPALNRAWRNTTSSNLVGGYSRSASRTSIISSTAGGALGAFAALGTVRTRDCLGIVLGREHAEDHRASVSEVGLQNAVGGCLADVVVVRRLAADHAPEGDDAVAVRSTRVGVAHQW